jgi:hypothetical protein
MAKAPDTLVGKSIEWTGVHYSEHGDFTDLSTHVVTYETERTCYVTADGKLAGGARYTYKRLDDRMAIVIYRPEQYQVDLMSFYMRYLTSRRRMTALFFLRVANHSRWQMAVCGKSYVSRP